VNSLPKTVTRQRRGCDLNPGPSVPESSTLTTRLPSHPNGRLPQIIRDYQRNHTNNNKYDCSYLSFSCGNIVPTLLPSHRKWQYSLEYGHIFCIYLRLFHYFHLVTAHCRYTCPSLPTRSTQPCIPPVSLNRVPASAGVRAGMSPLPGGR